MKNLFSVSAVFDVRGYSGSSVDQDFPFPYTFLLSQGEYICTINYLPSEFTTPEMLAHGVGYATREEAEKYRKQIITALTDVDIVAVIYIAGRIRQLGCESVCDCPSDAIARIRKLTDSASCKFTKEFIGAMHKTGRDPIQQTLQFVVGPCESCRYNIQLVRHIPASSATTPLLDWDAIGIK